MTVATQRFPDYLVGEHVVLELIPAMRNTDFVGLEVIDNLYDCGQRFPAVIDEIVIRQAQKSVVMICQAQYAGGATGFVFAEGDEFRYSYSIAVRSSTVGHNHNPDRRAELHFLCDRASTTKHFIIRMRRNDQGAATKLLRRPRATTDQSQVSQYACETSAGGIQGEDSSVKVEIIVGQSGGFPPLGLFLRCRSRCSSGLHARL